MPQSEKGVRGKGAAALCPASAHSAPGALSRSGIEDTTRPWRRQVAESGFRAAANILEAPAWQT